MTDKTYGHEMTIEVDVTPRSERVQRVTDLACSLVPEKTWLCHVEYDDHLTTDQIDLYLAGQIDTLYEQVYDDYAAEATERSVEYEVQRVVDEVENLLENDDQSQYQDLVVSEIDQERLRELIRDRDTNDPVAALINHTPNQLMRVPLFKPAENLNDPGRNLHGTHLNDPDTDAHESTVSDRTEAVLSKLVCYGLDPTDPVNVEAARSMATEMYDWDNHLTVDLVWYGPIKDLALTDRARTMVFQDPYLALMDTLNGMCVDARFTGRMILGLPGTATDPEAMRSGLHVPGMDQQKNGYGVDQICGVIKTAYACECTTLGPAQARD